MESLLFHFYQTHSTFLMKKITLLILVVTGTFLAYGNDYPTTIGKANISLVTVYLNGAEIQRESTIKVSEGRSVVIIPELSTSLLNKTIQGKFAANNIRILSISSSNDYFNPELESTTTKSLRKKLVDLNEQIDRYNILIDNFSQERDLILKNKARIGKDGGTDIAELTAAANFYRSRLNEISNKDFDSKMKRDVIKTEKSKISAQLREINKVNSIGSKSILITIDSPITQSSKLEIRYLVEKATWTPRYNIRSKSIESPVTFEYLANIRNGSNVDWDNIDLILSTGDPFKSMDKPTLNTWSLQFTNNRKNRKNGYFAVEDSKFDEGYVSDKKSTSNPTVMRGGRKDEYKASTSVEVSEVTVEFKIPIRYTIKANAKEHLVEVTTTELPASYKYLTIPKLDQDAFLIAGVRDWAKVNIIDAYANIYYDGNYVGETYINTQYANDTLDLSMGRDSKINISRAKIEDFNKKPWLGSNRKESFNYEISIRNNNSTPIKIEVLDQVPVSLENEINVTIENISEAKLNIESGRLKWNLEVEPGVTKKLTTSFNIKYPKNKSVNTKRTRKVVCPSYF